MELCAYSTVRSRPLWALIVPLVDNFRASGWLSRVRWHRVSGASPTHSSEQGVLGQLGPRMPHVTLPCLFGTQDARFRRQLPKWPFAEVSRSGVYVRVPVWPCAKHARVPPARTSAFSSVPWCCIFQVSYVRGTGQLCRCIVLVLRVECWLACVGRLGVLLTL